MKLRTLLSFFFLLSVQVYGVNVPYTFEFTSQEKFDEEWTVIDGNNDQSTWKYDYMNKEATCGFGLQDANDWLISLPIYLDAASEYQLSYGLRTFGNEESILVALGTAPTAEAMTLTLKDYPTLQTNGQLQENEITLKVEESGNYHLGFKYYSPAFCWGANVGTVKIIKMSGANPPKNVSDLTLTANQTTKTVVINFTAPSQDIENKPLSTLSKIEISRNGELIHTIENPTPGAKLSYDDQFTPFVGDFTYKLISYVALLPSDPTEKTITIEPLPSEEKIKVYSFLFDDKDLFDKTWTIINANNDDRTWTIAPYIPEVYYKWGNKQADDWLISPAIKMEAGKRYIISYYLKSSISFGENVKVMIGKSNTVEGQTTLLMDYVGLELNSATQFEVNYIPEEDNDYYIGFYCYSPITANWLHVSKFNVEYVKVLCHASAVTNLQAVEQDNKKIEVSWINPSVDSNGEDIYVTLPKIELFRNGTLINTFNDMKAGSEVKYIDDIADLTGEITYKVIPYMNSAPGEEASVSFVVTEEVIPEPKTVPYTFTFEDEVDFREWEITYMDHDNSNDDPIIVNTWSWENEDDNHFVRYNNRVNIATSGKDWFISPRIQLYKDVHYYIEMDVRSNGQNYMITMGTDSDILSQKEIITENTMGGVYPEFTTVQYPVEINQDGTYHFGFSSNRILANQYLDIDNFSIKPGILDQLSVQKESRSAIVFINSQTGEICCNPDYRILEIFDLSGRSLWKSSKGVDRILINTTNSALIVKVLSNDNEIKFVKTKN